jgi:hypothetical protein
MVNGTTGSAVGTEQSNLLAKCYTTAMSSLADDTRWLDATDQAALVRRGEVSPAELLDAAIERIEASTLCSTRSSSAGSTTPAPPPPARCPTARSAACRRS